MSEAQGRLERLQPRLQTEGEFAGWHLWDIDPFEHNAGPYYEYRGVDGAGRLAFRAEARHMNNGGFMHGGCLMSFADAALFFVAREALGEARGVTMHLAGDFLEPVPPGALMEATGEVVRAGGKTIYARGTLLANGRAALAFTGIIRKITERDHALSRTEI
ncbi:PaaI family thioesterase [Qipengyuania sp.]|uniref:PaaI family thioesterase n=1 Tax=Qipengyuania sp. TaxID=2004515 RepID=UPI00373547CB